MGCPRIYDPICAINGVEEITFSNDCEFRKYVCLNKTKMFRILRAGECTHEAL